MTEYCEQETTVGSVTTYCILSKGHNCECMFADPKVIQTLGLRDDGDSLK